MARYLYLLRHAESAEKQVGEHDRERELTQGGIREALLIGAHLLRENIKFDAIHTSTAVRSKATAVIVTDAMKISSDEIIEDDSLYEASTRTFFEFVTQLDDEVRSVLCVGHNPVITYLAESLTKAEIGDMPPAGLAVIKFSNDPWQTIAPGKGELESFVPPKMLMNQ